MKFGTDQNYASDEQLLLAKLLRIVVIVGLSLIVIGFIVYVAGVLPAMVSVEDVATLWHLSSGQYLEKTGVPTGWDWVRSLGNGDIVSFATLILISIAAIVAIGAIAVRYVRKRNWPYAVIVIVQTLILILAASGIVSGH